MFCSSRPPKIKKFAPFAQVRQHAYFKAAKNICFILKQNGFQAYFVGGSIRDLLLFPQKTPKEIDITTNAHPEQLKKIFSHTNIVGNAFAVALVKHEHFTFEIATFRKEGRYSDNRHPDSIEIGGTCYEDSCRRDFTINALYYDPCTKKVYDFHNGFQDLQNKILTCVGNPQDRLREDALRILRLFRLGTNLSFTISEQTRLAALRESPGLKALSKERILQEIQKVDGGKLPLFCKIIRDSLQYIFPLLENISFKKNTPLSFPASFHKNYPLFSIIYNIILYTKEQREWQNKLLQNALDWPLQGEDKKCIVFFLKLINLDKFIENYPQYSISFVVFYFLTTKAQGYEHLFLKFSIQYFQHTKLQDAFLQFLEKSQEKCGENTKKRTLQEYPEFSNALLLSILDKKNISHTFTATIAKQLEYLCYTGEITQLNRESLEKTIEETWSEILKISEFKNSFVQWERAL